MTGSRRLWLAAFGAICAVLALAAPASAVRVDSVVAVEPGPIGPPQDATPTGPPQPPWPPSEWWPAECATGTIADFRIEEDGSNQPALWISGRIQPCPKTGFTNGFTLIRYFGDMGIRSSRIEPYQSMSGSTAFTFQVAAPSGSILPPDLTALCVAYDVDGRVACLGVDQPAAGEPPVVAAIATDDPRVLPPVMQGRVYDIHICGTCL